ncbi:MAG: UMP kinase [Pseudomonadota bacterium]
MTNPKYSRVLLKLSGEALSGDKGTGIDSEFINRICCEIKEVVIKQCQVAIVIGGGNIFRGMEASAQGQDRVTGDHMGMLATVINSLALKQTFQSININSVVMSAINMSPIAEVFSTEKACQYLNANKVVIFSAGTGNPFFTTDTAAALRAAEIKADLLLKATKVDGVYDKDPVKYSDAKMFKSLEFMQVIKDQLKVIDATAASLCLENNIPLKVFNLLVKGNINKIIMGEDIGTTVK